MVIPYHGDKDLISIRDSKKLLQEAVSILLCSKTFVMLYVLNIISK